MSERKIRGIENLKDNHLDINSVIDNLNKVIYELSGGDRPLVAQKMTESSQNNTTTNSNDVNRILDLINEINGGDKNPSCIHK